LRATEPFPARYPVLGAQSSLGPGDGAKVL